MYRCSLFCILILTGCGSFFQSRVEEHDGTIRTLEEKKASVMETEDATRKALRIAEESGTHTEEIRKELESLRTNTIRIEKELSRERGERTEALKGASDEMKFKHSILAAVLGMGSAAVSALVIRAKRSV